MMGETAIMHLSVNAGKVPREIGDVTRVRIGIDNGARAHREASADLDPLETRNTLCESAIEEIGLSEPESVLDPITGFNPARNGVGGDYLAFKFGVKRCHLNNFQCGTKLIRPAGSAACL
jgi:hypothetical protein